MPSTLGPGSGREESGVEFAFDTHDADTIRRNPTTQIAIRVAEWPDNVFLLWLPESVSSLSEGDGSRQEVIWNSFSPDIVAHQDFSLTEEGGLYWTYDGNPAAKVEAELAPRGDSLALEVRVANRSGDELTEVSAQNCLHLSAAPDFRCDDFSRVFIRTGGEWGSLASLEPTCDFPMYYRPGFLESGRPDRWAGRFSDCNQPVAAGHPLMVCVATDGRRAVGTASEDYQCVFHNGRIAYLLCVHSQQAAVRALGPSESVTFRQRIYFTEGSLMDCVGAFEADINGDPSGSYAFRD